MRPAPTAWMRVLLAPVTTWMPQPRRTNDMAGTSTPYERTAATSTYAALRSDLGEVLVALVVGVGGVGEVGRFGALHRQVGRTGQRSEQVHQQLVDGQRVQGGVQRGGQPVRVARDPFGVGEGGRVDVHRLARVELAPDAVQARVDERAEGQVRVGARVGRLELQVDRTPRVPQ